MTQQNPRPEDVPSIIHHLSIGTNQLENALAFYDKVLATIGAKRVADYPEMAAAYGKQFPEVWVHGPYDGKPADPGNGQHFAFFAFSEQMVQDFYQTALAAGGTDDGKPGPRPDYGPCYYGCYVRDLDGNKIEAVFWDETKN